jgi:hypothetical protein
MRLSSVQRLRVILIGLFATIIGVSLRLVLWKGTIPVWEVSIAALTYAIAAILLHALAMFIGRRINIRRDADE